MGSLTSPRPSADSRLCALPRPALLPTSSAWPLPWTRWAGLGRPRALRLGRWGTRRFLWAGSARRAAGGRSPQAPLPAPLCVCSPDLHSDMCAFTFKWALDYKCSALVHRNDPTSSPGAPILGEKETERLLRDQERNAIGTRGHQIQEGILEEVTFQQRIKC